MSADTSESTSPTKGGLGHPKVSVVVPCYNEQETIRELVERTDNAMSGRSYELILVDDGSKDATASVIGECAERNPAVRALYLCANYGQTAAITAGIDASSGAIIVPMDGDLQNDPADIPRLLDKMEEGFDVVSGWRRDRHDPWSRVLPSKIANWLISRTGGVKLHDFGCTLKAYESRTLRSIELFGEMHRFIPIYAHWKGARITEIPVRHHPRKSGESKYGFSRILKVPLDMLVLTLLGSYATKPIHLFGKAGGYLALAGALCITVTAYYRIFEQIYIKDQPLFLVGIFLWLVATQLVGLGLVAELLTRVYHRGEQHRSYQLKD
jgi:glycosyltransferase involved in cell wall biosynthesis